MIEYFTRNSKVRIVILYLALFSTLMFSYIQADAATKLASSNISTTDIVSDTLNANKCLDYCFVGVCVWLICSLFECHLEYTVKISHYWPESTVSAFVNPGENPWDTIRSITKKMNADLANKISNKLMGGLFAGGGNRATDSHNLDHRNMIFKEVDAFGNPLACALNYLAGNSCEDSNSSSSSMGSSTNGISTGTDSNGNTTFAFNVPGSSSNSSSSSQQSTMNSDSQLTSDLNSFYNDLFKQMNSSSSTNMSSGTGGLAAAASSDSYFCPSAAVSFMPYFMSVWDYVPWRFGITDMFTTGAWVPGVDEIGDGLFWTWGAIYPREGFVTQASDPKGAAVTAFRAAHVYTRAKQEHIYQQLGVVSGIPWVWPPGPVKPNDPESHWQMLSPVSSKSCFIMGQDDRATAGGWGAGKTSPDGGYVFNEWRKYKCCTDPHGIFVGSVEWGKPICPFS